ncbi:type II secretion system minor pseudopilin GspI [Marinobacterium stanieri]|uniref:Type II secretion system protein I n=1 Tax=Marinobacterium stanieri TaxID=49186 RepID=A0A1N6XIZ2_9GAMM|nr:type II secretion system minor pseudopilin GspI [Marinobacterium stanieri]SIR02263.1 type II secretion system protein I (GspI) [Marinobacterium stanieri]
MTRIRQRGVTLLELLVALFIFAVAVGALLKVLGEQARIVETLEQRYFAQLVAHNHLAELRLQQTWPALGQRNQKRSLAGLDLRLVEDVTETDDPALRRVATRVYSADADLSNESPPLAEIQAFMGATP